MKTYAIIRNGKVVAKVYAAEVRFVRNGIDFQPNIFNSYHALELGDDDPPAVLNLPEGTTIEESHS